MAAATEAELAAAREAEAPALSVCVSCGSKRVERRVVSVTLADGRVFGDIEADVCAACGERYYDLEGMKRLEAATIP